MKKNLLHHILLVDFFSTLFHHKRRLFYFFLFFSLIQLGLTAIKLEVTPFFLYGMFSEKTPYTGKVMHRYVFLNHIAMDSFHIASPETALLLVDLDNYLIIKNNNNEDVVKSRVESRYPFFTGSFLYPFVKNKIYNTPGKMLQFESWFKTKCSQYTGIAIHTVCIQENTYLFDAAHLSFKLIRSETVAAF